MPVVPEGCRHVYYLYVVRLDPDVLGVSRDAFAAALGAEGVPVGTYVEPLYRQPVYRERAAAAFADPRNQGSGAYEDGQCPTCERVQDHEVLTHPFVHAGLGAADIDDIVTAFRKVHARRGELVR